MRYVKLSRRDHFVRRNPNMKDAISAGHSTRVYLNSQEKAATRIAELLCHRGKRVKAQTQTLAAAFFALADQWICFYSDAANARRLWNSCYALHLISRAQLLEGLACFTLGRDTRNYYRFVRRYLKRRWPASFIFQPSKTWGLVPVPPQNYFCEATLELAGSISAM
jgi:hypothetical protein